MRRNNVDLSLEKLYSLSHEYSSHARKMAPFLASDAQIKQYRTLIYHAIGALQTIKAQFQLSAEQDVLITLELCDLLTQETNDLDLAEMYLSSVHERLYGTELLHQKMLVASALIKVARARKSTKHSKSALRIASATLKDLENYHSPWTQYFLLLRIELMIDTSPLDSRISELYNELITNCDSVTAFQTYVICSYICYCFYQHQNVNQEHLDTLAQLNKTELPTQLRLWKNLIDLLLLIYRDQNITSKLSEFKDLVAAHKKELTNSTFFIRLDDRVIISLDTPIVRYKDFKHVILLFQSVSYLTNCYDKKANFSVKYLPKVRKAASELLSSPEEIDMGLTNIRRAFYKQIIDLSNYYSCLESLILTGDCLDIEGDSDYAILVKAMKLQLRRDTKAALESYLALQDSKRSPEFQLIGLCSEFAISTATMSRTGGTVPFHEYQKVDNIWNSIEKLFKTHSFSENHIWRCTLVVLWICGHFQPFTNAELSKSNDSDYLEKLRLYYTANSFARLATHSPQKPKDTHKNDLAPVLKKSLLLHFLLNYLSSAIVVHDLEEKCLISNSCFHLCKQQHMPLMEYIAGLSHLLNCGLAMKSKDVSITRNKLKCSVQKLLTVGFEQAQ
ncbi:LANO_0F03642g1_1 [Lachancea nothofagi CBS 11611]|uniref:LANO_0F03642g1_1 n=1 Tax=Lachancea nothofagi CBS 11611 TaxID=1266666 RepID=A0A1G4K796_9SACH|nr:LANO_0F03642g1_1 [Lachancea nothofagi CBS 11611]